MENHKVCLHKVAWVAKKLTKHEHHVKWLTTFYNIKRGGKHAWHCFQQ